MKYNKIYTAIALLSCGLPFCSCQNGLEISDEAENVISLKIFAPKANPKSESRSFVANDRMGLYVVDYKDEFTPMPLQISGNRANNVALSFNGSSWTPERTIYWGNIKSDVYAYYPYMESIEDINSQPFSVGYDQSKSISESDFLWAKAEGVTNGNGIGINMTHLMSKLTVRIVAGESYVGSLPEDATILLHSTVADARVDLETGTVIKDPYKGVKSIKMHKLGLQSIGGVDAVVYEAIVIPQMLKSSVPLFEINSKSVSYMVEDSFNFKPGTAYVYTVSLNASTTAIQVEIGCEIEDWNSTGGGSSSGGSGGGEGGTNHGDDDNKTYIDLSSEGTANCYLISAAGDYKFPAVLGNTNATVGNVKSVEVLWESFGTDITPNVGDLIASASYKDGYVRFSTPTAFKNGNAVIAVKNKNDVILWSWHIWCSEEGWKEQEYYNNAGIMMDRNLGATSATPGDVGALGLFYQWGRKNPFIGSSTIYIYDYVQTGSTRMWTAQSGYNTQFIIENPSIFYIDYQRYENLGVIKETSDPCPPGWKVPEGGEDGIWSKALGTSEVFSFALPPGGRSNGGVNLTGILGNDPIIWYPQCGYIKNNGVLEGVGQHGYYWSVTTASSSEKAPAMYINWTKINPASYAVKASGYSVRCCKE